MILTILNILELTCLMNGLIIHQLHFKLSVKMVNLIRKKKTILHILINGYRRSIIGHLPVFNDIVNSMNVQDSESIHCCVTKFSETDNKLGDPF